ncbi:MAG: sigma-70 family RNA polymerase sigma factor [Gammaproteobacteria bacterium]|nr:sigma-70 family RNA polymerase sigma factor [Gammaproteobacteria bacterium]
MHTDSIIDGPWAGREESLTDEKLVERFQAGDQAAFETLYGRYRDRVYAVVKRFVTDAADADDLVQDVFLKALLALPRFRGDSQLFTWLYRIAMNAGINFKSRRSAEYSNAKLLEPTTDIGPERLCMGVGDARQAQQAIDRLSPPLRQALVLNVVRGFDYEEVSTLADCPIGTVRSRISRARRQIAQGVAAETVAPATVADR